MSNFFSKRFFVWLTIILFATNIALIAEYYSLGIEINEIKSESEKVILNKNVLSFTKMFIKQVIKSDKEVDFDTRLQLENSVRSIKDNDVMYKWKSFIDSKTEVEAQDNVKNLLEVLIDKIAE